MVKGISIKFDSYIQTIPKLLKIVKFDDELKKHEKVILKPNLINGQDGESTPVDFVEQILKFCMENKNPGTEIFIAEGCDGKDTMEVFGSLGYRKLAEKYGVTLVDLNKADVEEMEKEEFTTFPKIMCPKILLDGFVISLPILRENWEAGINASLDNMIGAYPSKYYSGIFSKSKTKLKKYELKNLIHDIVLCKNPDFAIIDSSGRGNILAGNPLEMDKQAARLMGLDIKNLPHLKLIEESLSKQMGHS